MRVRGLVIMLVGWIRGIDNCMYMFYSIYGRRFMEMTSFEGHVLNIHLRRFLLGNEEYWTTCLFDHHLPNSYYDRIKLLVVPSSSNLL
jgi:hypothetical protein